MKRKEKKGKNEDEETIVLVVKGKRKTKENFKNTNKVVHLGFPNLNQIYLFRL